MKKPETTPKKTFNLSGIDLIAEAEKQLRDYQQQLEEKIRKRSSSATNFFGEPKTDAEPQKRKRLTESLLKLIEKADLRSLYQAIQIIEQVRFGEEKLATKFESCSPMVSELERTIAVFDSKLEGNGALPGKENKNQSDSNELTFKPAWWTKVLPAVFTGSRQNFDDVLSTVHCNLIFAVTQYSILIDIKQIENDENQTENETLLANLQRQYKEGKSKAGLNDLGRGMILKNITIESEEEIEAKSEKVKEFLENVKDGKKVFYQTLIENCSFQALLAEINSCVAKYFLLPKEIEEALPKYDAKEEFFLDENNELFLRIDCQTRCWNPCSPPCSIVLNSTGQLEQTDEPLKPNQTDEYSPIIKIQGCIKFGMEKSELGKQESELDIIDGYVSLISATEAIPVNTKISEQDLQKSIRNKVQPFIAIQEQLKSLGIN